MRNPAAFLGRRSVLRIGGASLAALAVAPAARAHHGWGSYDASKTISLTGPIRALKYANPHCQMTLLADGRAWDCVLAPPFRMENRGLPDGLLKVGMTVTVVGYASTAHESEMRAERIVVDGKTVELR